MLVGSERRLSDLQVTLYSQSALPLPQGNFEIAVYQNNRDSTETVTLSKGLSSRFSKADGEISPLFVRLHSECLTGDVFGSLRCDCGLQLEKAIDEIERRGVGVIIYLRQEGRGIGLGNKIRAYKLQQQKGLNTLEANQALGFPGDLRDYDIAALILKSLGIERVHLNTNNPAKVEGLTAMGITVVDVVPALVPLNAHNVDYMQAKCDFMGHVRTREEPLL